MQIVLHVGFHKTGTTSIQAALAAHKGALEAAAVIQTRRVSPDLAHAVDAARRYSRQPDRMRQRRLRRAMDAWVAALPDPAGRVVLVSSEDFAGHMPGRYGLADYGAAVQTVPVAVDALLARFAPASLAVLVTTRAAEPWLRSLHWQLSQHPDLTLAQREFCRDYAGAADFDAVLRPLQQALQGRATLHTARLETLTAHRLGPVSALYALAGLPDALLQGLPAVPPRNARVAEGLADQFVAMNRAGLPEEELARAKAAMRGLMEQLEADTPPRPLFDARPDG